jgi:hypothetical protein
VEAAAEVEAEAEAAAAAASPAEASPWSSDIRACSAGVGFNIIDRRRR